MVKKIVFLSMFVFFVSRTDFISKWQEVKEWLHSFTANNTELTKEQEKALSLALQEYDQNIESLFEEYSSLVNKEVNVEFLRPLGTIVEDQFIITLTRQLFDGLKHEIDIEANSIRKMPKDAQILAYDSYVEQLDSRYKNELSLLSTKVEEFARKYVEIRNKKFNKIQEVYKNVYK